jgi:hypothetical protein
MCREPRIGLSAPPGSAFSTDRLSHVPRRVAVELELLGQQHEHVRGGPGASRIAAPRIAAIVARWRRWTTANNSRRTAMLHLHQLLDLALSRRVIRDDQLVDRTLEPNEGCEAAREQVLLRERGGSSLRSPRSGQLLGLKRHRRCRF